MSESTPRSAARAAWRPLQDPEAVPYDPAFDDPRTRGRAVPLDRLTPAALRARLAFPPPWQPEISTDARIAALTEPPRPAAVLIPLVAAEDKVSVLLTQRTAHLSDHAGQISFPGGRVEEHDADAVATALRESVEEIGLAASAIEVLGSLPLYVTATGFQITPVVGLIERPFSLDLDAFEVEEAFRVPLDFLMDPANHERRRIDVGGVARTFYAMPYTAARRYYIWGATAAMLRNFYHLLRA